MKKRDVQMLARCNYERIDDEGLHITIDGDGQLLGMRRPSVKSRFGTAALGFGSRRPCHWGRTASW